MEAWRHAQPTGTNRRRQTHASHTPYCSLRSLTTQGTADSHAITRGVHHPVPRQPHNPPHHPVGTHNRKTCGGHGPGETPSTIPNLEAKTWHGDDTPPDRVRESSAPPHHNNPKPLPANDPEGASPYTRPPRNSVRRQPQKQPHTPARSSVRTSIQRKNVQDIHLYVVR